MIERAIEAVRRTIGSGQARLYADLAAVRAGAPAEDLDALARLLLDALCGEFDPFRTPDGDAAAALRAALEPLEVTAPTRVLLQTVLGDLVAGAYDAPDDAELWVGRLLARHCRPMRAAIPRPVIAPPPYRGRVTPRLAEVYRIARSRIERGHAPTSTEIAGELVRSPDDVRAALSSLVALGLLVEIGPDRVLDLGAIDAG